MSELPQSQRTVSTPSTGAKICLLVAVPFVILAAYFFFTPQAIGQKDGGLFYCGAPASPNAGATQVCSPIEAENRNKALASLGSGLAIAGLGLALFGVNRRTEDVRTLERRQRIATEDAWDEPVPEAAPAAAKPRAKAAARTTAKPATKTAKPASKATTKANAKVTRPASAKATPARRRTSTARNESIS